MKIILKKYTVWLQVEVALKILVMFMFDVSSP